MHDRSNTQLYVLQVSYTVCSDSYTKNMKEMCLSIMVGLGRCLESFKTVGYSSVLFILCSAVVKVPVVLLSF